jgi:hypothetical protein
LGNQWILGTMINYRPSCRLTVRRTNKNVCDIFAGWVCFRAVCNGCVCTHRISNDEIYGESKGLGKFKAKLETRLHLQRIQTM